VRIATPRVLDGPAGSAPTPQEEEEAIGRTSESRSSRSSNYRARRTRRNRRTAAKQAFLGGAGFKLLIAAGVVVALGAIAALLFFSSIFPITNVTVAGNLKLQSGYVIKLADVPQGSTYFRTDTESIKARLLTEPWILDASVERGFPDTLVLRIVEQPIAAVVSIVPESANDSIQQWVIAEDGTWIAQVEDDVVGQARINADELLKLTKIKDINAAVRPQAGVRETDEGILNALTLLTGFSNEMREMVAVISAPDAVQTNLKLYNNVTVAFGLAEDIEAKELAIATLLAEHEGYIISINVRVADRASYSGTQ